MTKSEFTKEQRLRGYLGIGLMVALFVILFMPIFMLMPRLSPHIQAYGAYLRSHTGSPATTGALGGLTGGLVLAGIISVLSVPLRLAVRGLQLKCPSCSKRLVCPGVMQTGRCCHCQAQVFTESTEP